MNLHKTLLSTGVALMLLSGTILVADGSQLSLLSDTETRRLQFTGKKEPVVEAKAPPIIYVIKQTLPEFLKQAARRDEHQIALSSSVQGILKNISLPMGIEKILEEIAPQFGLQWHFHKQKIYVSHAKESITQSVELGAMDMDDLELAMKDASLRTDDYNLSYVSESHTILIKGPENYIASVEQIVRSFWKNRDAREKQIKASQLDAASKE